MVAIASHQAYGHLFVERGCRVRLGVKIPNIGPGALSEPGMVAMARLAEDAGVDALHLSDHVVLVEGATSRYPFTPDGTFPWPPDLDVYDPMASCAWIAAHTSKVHVGPSVLVLPQRQPLEVAKTAATIDRLSGGRLFLGVGAGWLAEEFAALGQDFATRAGRLEEGIAILRRVWSGDTSAFDGEHLRFGHGVHCRPLPERPGGIPLLVGGMSRAALRRAATVGDGWIAIVGGPRSDLDGLSDALRHLDELRAAAGRRDAAFRTVARVIGVAPGDLPGLPEWVAELAALGFDEVAVDPLWRDLDEVAGLLRDCREAVHAV
jgi:probable F420-dependent oxidoreductase